MERTIYFKNNYNESIQTVQNVKIEYFKEIKDFKKFVNEQQITGASYWDLHGMAQELYKNITFRNDFEDQNVYITSSDLKGFYFPSTQFIRKKGIKFYMITFKIHHSKYNKTNKTMEKITWFEPVAIFEDNQENYYTIESTIINNINLENELKQINNIIERYKKLIEKWQDVEILTTKEGKPFKILSKNFKNAYITYENYAPTRTLRVLDDSIDLHFMVDKNDEIKTKINDHLIQLKEWKINQEKNIKYIIPLYYETMINHYKTAIKYNNLIDHSDYKMQTFTKHLYISL